MFSRYIDNIDFKSRFRILKGGKISLIISAMLLGSIVNVANATNNTLNNTTLSATISADDTVSTEEDITSSAGGINIMGETNTFNTSINHNVTITNSSVVEVSEIGSGSSLIISSGKTLTSNNGDFGLNLNTSLDNTDITNNGTIDINSGMGGIYISDLVSNGSTITNAVGATIDVTGTASSEARGIELAFVPNPSIIGSEITNDGTINIVQTLGTVSNGIFVADDAIDSQITNNGNMTIKVERDLVNSDFISSIDLYSAGMYLERVMSDSNSIRTEVINTNSIDVLTNTNITSTDQVYSYEMIAESKGIYISYLAGSFQDTKAYFNNSGEIKATSRLNIDFTNEGDSLNLLSSDIKAISTGLELDGKRADINNTSTGKITALAEINIDEKGTVNSYQLGAESNGIKSYSLEDVTLSNKGSIDSTAIFNGSNDSYAFANGIHVYGFVNASTISLENEIIVKAEATADEYSDIYANGIYVRDGFYDSTIENSGDITVTAKAAQTGEKSGYASSNTSGICVYDFGEDSRIVNSGNIDVSAEANSYNYSYAEAYGIYVSSEGTGIIENSGNIKVNAKSTIVDENSSGILAESYGISVAAYQNGQDLSIINSSSIEAYVDNKLDRDGYSLYINNSPYLYINNSPQSSNFTVTNSGILKGNIYVNGSLENSGTIELAYNAMNDDSAYIQDFINKEDGKLTIGLKTDGTLDGTEYSQLNTESATFENGSTIDVNVLSASTNSGLLAGKRLENVVTADTELTINGKLNVTDNSALLNFEYKTSDDWINGEDGAIHLDVVKSSNNNIVDNTISGGGTQNSQAAASALQTIQDNGNHPNMNRVFTSLNQLSSSEAVAHAVESTTPVATSATVGATTQISNGIAGIVSQRQNANISSGGMNSGDGMFSENNLWIKPFGSIGSQNDKDGINGFDLKTYGLGFGADTEYKNNQRLGLAFFYTNGNVDVNNMNQNADLDVFTTLIYGNVPVIDDKTNFLYQAGYAWQKTQTDRAVFTGDIAESKYTSKTASLDLKLMRDVNVNKDLLLQPLVNTTYRHFTNPAYNETGADALNLNVDKFTSSDLIVGLGTLAHYKLTDDSKIVGNVNVGYDLHDKNQTVTSAYEGATGVNFGTDGIDNGRWSYEVGIGYEMDINKTNNINVSYDYQGQGKDFSNNVVSAKYVLKF